MRYVFAAIAAAASVTGVAHAADKPVIGPAPAWVKPVELTPAATAKSDGAAVRVLLSDQQADLRPGKQTVYTEVALKIQTPQGLAAGNLSFPWRPETDVLSVHKLNIRRGDTVIDVLASGQTFTVVRREANLESATLDGVLTANIQPEGLQVGDIIEFAASIASSDPTMKDHVEEIAGAWNGFPIGKAHLRLQWPSSVPARLRATAPLPALKTVKTGNISTIDLTLDDVEPLVLPKRAPSRYQVGRLVEFTDFASWADLGALLAPLYEKAAVLPADGPLKTEFDRIRTASTDPKARAEAALALVQDRIRYVALAMGTGGLVPADAAMTWSRRYGDCKAKTAMLLALLRALDIPAEPVAVSTAFGDGLDARLPMIGLFNHVLVRATIAGRAYWLDGTRTGDTSLDRIVTPAFGWGLPLTPRGAALVRMLPTPLDLPGHGVAIRIDATAGLTVPAPVTVDAVFRGDSAIATNLALANQAGEARDRALRDYWRGEYDFVDPKTVSAVFDAKTGEMRLSMQGSARMDWSSGWYETDGTRIGYKADFSREPGPDRDAPFAVNYPMYDKTVETIVLPPGFSTSDQDLKAEVDETVAGMAYRRHATITGNAVTIEASTRSVAPEFSAKGAEAAQTKLRDLFNHVVYLRKPDKYVPTSGDMDAILAKAPDTAKGFVDRGNLLLDKWRLDDAVKDFDSALAIDPKNVWALADRGIARVWLDQGELARKDLAAAAAIEPKNPVIFRARGLLAQQAGSSEEAIAAYTAALGVDPKDNFSLTRRAQAYRTAGNLDAALQDAATALKNDPRAIDVYLLRANIFRSQGKTDQALAEAAAATAANPNEAYAHVAAANLYRAFHKDADAMREYDRAIAIAPEPYIYLNRALRRPKADVAGRRADLDAALKLDPAFVEAIGEKAALLAEGKDFTGAVALYTAALAKSPESAPLLGGRGIAYARSGDTTRAEADFAAARAKAKDAMTLNGLCWTKATAGVALVSALADCDAALAKSPANTAILDSRGFVLLRLGRIDEAIGAYDRALGKGALAPSLFGRSVAWSRKGDKAKAAADAAAALKIDANVESDFEGYGVKPG